MTRKLLAGAFSAVPIRVHVYPSRGAHMFVDATGAGCWTDPEGKVLLFSMDDCVRVASAHGYTIDPETNMVVSQAGKIAPDEPDAAALAPTTDLLDGADAATPDVNLSPPEGVTIPEPALPSDPEGALKVLEKGEGVEENAWTPPEGFVLQKPFAGQDPELAIFMHEDGRRIFTNTAMPFVVFAPLMFAPLPEGFTHIGDEDDAGDDHRVADVLEEAESALLALFARPDGSKMLLLYDSTVIELPARVTPASPPPEAPPLSPEPNITTNIARPARGKKGKR